jgi:carboxymethylenebutenolidase
LELQPDPKPMKTLFFISAFLLTAICGFAQKNAITVCHTSSTEKFAMFASNKDFNKEHQRPRAYVHFSQEGGKMIAFKTPGGSDAYAYFIPAKSKTDNWILVFQEWWGLNDNIKRQSEQLYKDLGNVNILALDMYDGKVSTERESAAKYMQEFRQERGDAIVKGAMDYVGKNAKIGTIGWCFGGGQSLLASITAGKQAIACVMYYGMPTDNLDALKSLNTDVLGLFAAKDKYITTEVVKKFEDNMKIAGKNIVTKSYDAEHGFANPSNSIFNKEATEDAWKLTLGFFKARLK